MKTLKKKAYNKPMIMSEEFIPQEYVAACATNQYSYVTGWTFRFNDANSGDIDDVPSELRTSNSQFADDSIILPTPDNNIESLEDLKNYASISSKYSYTDSDSDGNINSGDIFSYTYNGVTYMYKLTNGTPYNSTGIYTQKNVS